MSHPVLKNIVRDRLKSGGLALGFVAHQLRGAAVPLLAKSCGFDWVFIDLEHGSYGLDGAIQTCASSISAGITPIVRIGEGSFHQLGPLLDHGAMGVVAPHIDTAEQARQFVEACKFPPIGRRSWIFAGPSFGYAPVAPAIAQPQLNDATLVCVQIETRLAVQNAFEIASVPGVDILMIGTGDYSTEIGVPGQVGHSDIRKAYGRVGEACRSAGKILGMGGVYDEDCMRDYIRLGARFMLAGSDQNFLIYGATQRSRFLRQLEH